MTNNRIIKASVLTFLPITCHTAFCQDSILATTDAIQQRYNAAFVEHPLLYNGPEYVDYSRRYQARNGHQFYLAPEEQPGSVYYNNHYFSDLHLAYDVVLDQLVMALPTNPRNFRLVNEHVGYFTLGNHRFVRLETTDSTASFMPSGYYEVLVDGEVQVLAKRTKRLSEQINQRVITANFIPSNKLYLSKNGTYYPISSKRTALRVLSDKPKVQQYLKVNNISFNKSQLETTLIKLTQEYNN